MQEPKSAFERAADDALAALRSAPPLALVAAIAALFELLLARIAWNGLPDVVELDALRELRDLARFPRNLAAVSGIVALVFALVAFLRHAGFAPIGRRLAIAAFSGVFVPSLLVATALPYASLRARLVVFGLAAANVLVTLVAMTAIRYRPPLGLRIASPMLAATAFSSLLVIGLGLVMTAEGGAFGWLATLLSEHPTTSQRVLLALRHLGEIGWLSVVLAASSTLLYGAPRGRDVRFVSAAAILALIVAASVAFRVMIGHRFRLMIFGAFRLGLFVDEAPLLYAVPVGVGVAGGLVGLASKDPAYRQLGVGVLLWLASGYAPHTPIQLLYLLLAAMLMTRSAQALDPRGAWRRHHPWLSLLQRRVNSPQ